MLYVTILSYQGQQLPLAIFPEKFPLSAEKPNNPTCYFEYSLSNIHEIINMKIAILAMYISQENTSV